MLWWTQAMLMEHNIQYIVKVDDDVWLNLHQFNKTLLQITEESVKDKRSYIAGHLNTDYRQVIRSPENKVLLLIVK